MSVLWLERHQVDGSRRSEHDTALALLLDAMRAADGFLWADAAASIVDDEMTTVVSEWRTQADLEAFRAGEAYSAFARDVEVALREAPSLRRFEG